MPADGENLDYFGCDVAPSGDTTIIGAPCMMAWDLDVVLIFFCQTGRWYTGEGIETHHHRWGG